MPMKKTKRYNLTPAEKAARQRALDEAFGGYTPGNGGRAPQQKKKKTVKKKKTGKKEGLIALSKKSRTKKVSEALTDAGVKKGAYKSH